MKAQDDAASETPAPADQEGDAGADEDAPQPEGFVDLVNTEVVAGWAWCPDDPERRMVIEVVVTDDSVVTLVADTYRQDLASGGVGDGCYGFVHHFPERLDAGTVDQVQVRFSGTEVPLSRPRTADQVVQDMGTLVKAVTSSAAKGHARLRAGLVRHEQAITTLKAEVADLTEALRDDDVFLYRIDERLRRLEARLDAQATLVERRRKRQLWVMVALAGAGLVGVVLGGLWAVILLMALGPGSAGPTG